MNFAFVAGITVTEDEDPAEEEMESAVGQAKYVSSGTSQQPSTWKKELRWSNIALFQCTCKQMIFDFG